MATQIEMQIKAVKKEIKSLDTRINKLLKKVESSEKKAPVKKPAAKKVAKKTAPKKATKKTATKKATVKKPSPEKVVPKKDLVEDVPVEKSGDNTTA